jgi:peptidoglycan/xylan/chitin deacetylase (PgdA/CDA1 family)
MKQALASAAVSHAGIRAIFGRLFRWSGLLVLNYHRVGDGAATIFDRGVWSATSDAFDDQVRFCKAHFDVIAPADLPGVLARGRGRHVLFTFDDGYRDNYEVAFPILRSARVSAAFFVTTGFIDSPRVAWWDEIAWMVRTSRQHAVELPRWLSRAVPFDEPDRERAVRTLLRKHKSISGGETEAYLNDIAEATASGRCKQQAERSWMTWAMLREMRAAGMTIGGHTVNHPVLSRVPAEVQLHEIETCSQRLETELGEPMRYFSYPVGGWRAFDAVTTQCLKRAGVQYAFSYYAGYRRFEEWDDYDIRRVPVESYLTRDGFRSIVTWPQAFA